MPRYEFGNEFQDLIASAILKNTHIVSTLRDVIHPEYFSDPLLRKIISKVIDFYKLHKSVPNKWEFCEFCRGDLGKAGIGRIKKLYRIRISNVEFVTNKIIEFAQFSAMKEAILDSADMIENSDNRLKIRTKIDKALKVGVDVNNLGVDLLGGRRTRYLHRLKYGLHDSNIGTGLNNLDNITGGLSRGELGLVMAPPKGFKSGTLTNLAFGAMANRYKVVIYTFEMSELSYTTRLERRISGLTKDELVTKERDLEKALRMIEVIGGGVFIKGFPMRTKTVEHIHSHLLSLKSEGFIPDVVIVDYWDLIKPESNSGEYRHQLASIGTGLRAMAQEENVAVWTASQVNRKAVDKKIIRKDDIAEAFEKIAIVDLAIAICQTKDERKLNPSRARLFVVANRDHEEAGTAYVTIDYDRMRIRELDEDYLEDE